MDYTFDQSQCCIQHLDRKCKHIITLDTEVFRCHLLVARGSLLHCLLKSRCCRCVIQAERGSRHGRDLETEPRQAPEKEADLEKAAIGLVAAGWVTLLTKSTSPCFEWAVFPPQIDFCPYLQGNLVESLTL